MNATLRRFSLPLRSPMETAAGRIDRRDGLLVRSADEEVPGVGEATPLAGWTESPAECQERLEVAVDRLETAGPEEALATLADAPAARHGLSLALADRTARVEGVPLYRHLGARRRVEFIPVNAVIDDVDRAETAAAAKEATAAGFSCLKVKVGGRPVEADAERLLAVRDAVGPDVTLRADANGAWEIEEARSALDAFAESGVEYVEQPLTTDDLGGHRDLRGGPVGVALDESVVHVGVEDCIEAAAADVLVLKPMALGGLDRTRTAAARAEDAGLETVVTGTVDGAVARTGAAHLAASLGDPTAAGLATAQRLAEDVAEDPAPVVEGRMGVPQTPGHGVDVGGWR